MENFKVLDFIPIGICVIDNNFIVRYWNYCLGEWTNIDSINIIGKNILDFVPKLGESKYKHQIENILDGGPPVIFSPQLHKNFFTTNLKEKEQKIEHINVSAIPMDDGLYYAIFSIEDVTDLLLKIGDYKRMRDQALLEIEQRILAEYELNKSKEQLIELNATKDKFFSIIAHDLRNPISAFKGVIEFLSDQFMDLSDDEKIEFITELKISSNNVFELLQNLLTWSRSQRGNMEYNPTELNLNYIANSNVSLLKIAAAGKGINLINGLTEDIVLYADANMVNTIIRNLITNAIKFTPNGGSVTLNAEKQTDNFALISITDTGIGIPEDKIAKLFRIDTSFTTPGTSNEKGTGLGLIICKEFVDKHQGKIFVKSKAGIGTSFYFTIPLLSEEPSED